MIERISVVYLLADGEREIVARAARQAAESGVDARETLRMFAGWRRAFEETERARGGVHADEAQDTATRLASYANANR